MEIPATLQACRKAARVRGWEWMKGMTILEGTYIATGDSGIKYEKCEGVRVDDVILRAPFCDKHMQCIKNPVPDLEDSATADLAVSRLRELWRSDAVRMLESGSGWAIMTRSGQYWSPTKSECILTAFESIPWNEIDNIRQKK